MENETRNIGLKQAKVLCQLPHQKRLNFFAKGLPIIQESADGYWKASLQPQGIPGVRQRYCVVTPSKKPQKRSFL